MKKRDQEWSGLLKIPDEAVIKQLRKELSDKQIEIGKLKSYIEELEYSLKDKKTHIRQVYDRYAAMRYAMYLKAENEADNNRKGVKKQNKKLREEIANLRKQISELVYEFTLVI